MDLKKIFTKELLTTHTKNYLVYTKIMPTKFVWTPELHELYMCAVDKLGGPEVGIATPISILHEE